MKKLIFVTMLVSLFGGMMIACSGDDEQGISFTSYNAGLAIGFVDYASLRQPEIVSALAAEKSDVICLQEVWNQDQIDAILDGTKDAYPHSYYEITEGEVAEGDEPACTTDETDPLVVCVEDKCPDVDPENLGTCALENCLAEFSALSSACVGCATGELGKSIDEIVEACTTAAGGSWAYDGHNGLLMLSKIPFKAKEFMTFNSYLNVRSVLHTTLETEQFGTMEVFCTHLTATLSDVGYAGEYGSWDAERSYQIDELIKYVDDESEKTRASVVMGDMNCGPETSNVNAEFAENYQQFVDGGMKAPYVDYALSPCTWCDENTLTGGADSGGEDAIIDHVMFKYMPEDTSYASQRVLDAAITITDDDEGDIETRLSDHYGVEVIAIP